MLAMQCMRTWYHLMCRAVLFDIALALLKRTKPTELEF